MKGVEVGYIIVVTKDCKVKKEIFKWERSRIYLKNIHIVMFLHEQVKMKGS